MVGTEAGSVSGIRCWPFRVRTSVNAWSAGYEKRMGRPEAQHSLFGKRLGNQQLHVIDARSYRPRATCNEPRVLCSHILQHASGTSWGNHPTPQDPRHRH